MTSSCNYLDDAERTDKKINQLSATLESFFFHMKSTILKESRMTQILWLPLIKKRDALKEKKKKRKEKKTENRES